MRAAEHPDGRVNADSLALSAPTLDDAILTIGTERFAGSLFQILRQKLAIRQLVILRYRPGQDVEPLAMEADRSDGAPLRGRVDEYVRRLHPQDPFRRQLAPSPNRLVDVRAVAARDVRDEEYRERLFTRAGLTSKLSILVRERDFALSISLYSDHNHGPFCPHEARWVHECRGLIGAAVQRHYSLEHSGLADDIASLTEAFLGIDLTSPLSSREASVCAHIVKGFSNLAIALELGLSVHSVATYRRRAYSKLGVTSPTELFGILLRKQETRST